MNPTPVAAVGNLIDARPRWRVVTGSLLLVVVLGWIDYITGPQVAFSIFYLLPIASVAWKLSRRAAVAVSLLSAVTWLVADVASGQHYGQTWIPVWNTASRFAVFVLVAALIDGLRNALKEQETLARMDPLTGVENPRAFMEHARELLEQMRLDREPLTLAYIDVDNFKQVNDSLGHSGGDDLLRAIGTALVQVTRETDRVGRLGGDEFALLLPNTGSEGARSVLEGLHARVAATLNGRAKTMVSLSAGAVTFLVPPHDLDEMVNAADNLMYEAKRAGKDTFRHVTVGAGSPSAADDRSSPRVIRLDDDVVEPAI